MNHHQTTTTQILRPRPMHVAADVVSGGRPQHGRRPRWWERGFLFTRPTTCHPVARPSVRFATVRLNTCALTTA